MSLVVVDASIAKKKLFAEIYSDKTEQLFQDAAGTRQRIVAPPLLTVEITNVVRKRMVSEGLTLARGIAPIDDFLLLPITLLDPPGLHHQALTFAAAHSLGAHDAHYVALAYLFGCELWVDDRRMLRAVQGRLPFVKWIGDYASTSNA